MGWTYVARGAFSSPILLAAVIPRAVAPRVKASEATAQRLGLPGRDAIIRLIGAVLAERNNEWTEGRRYMGPESSPPAASRKMEKQSTGTSVTIETIWCLNKTDREVAFSYTTRRDAAPG